ncbi:unnamed protein product [Brassica napus]|uniref:(rape) hypothetical protein n=1 Tax=Brassica napus TaxID=3708 RepID=A0A816KST7_BRANA|nr:unnamed protein product [Brassica napus]
MRHLAFIVQGVTKRQKISFTFFANATFTFFANATSNAHRSLCLVICLVNIIIFLYINV